MFKRVPEFCIPWNEMYFRSGERVHLILASDPDRIKSGFTYTGSDGCLLVRFDDGDFYKPDRTDLVWL